MKIFGDIALSIFTLAWLVTGSLKHLGTNFQKWDWIWKSCAHAISLTNLQPGSAHSAPGTCFFFTMKNNNKNHQAKIGDDGGGGRRRRFSTRLDETLDWHVAWLDRGLGLDSCQSWRTLLDWFGCWIRLAESPGCASRGAELVQHRVVTNCPGLTKEPSTAEGAVHSGIIRPSW